MGDGRTVYVVTAGEYSDYRICNVFAREEDAHDYASRITRCWDEGAVEEYELHEGPIERRTWHTLLWRSANPDSPGVKGQWLPNPSEHTEDRDFDGHANHAEHTWEAALLRVSGWDLDRVRKVYSEQRAWHEARESGLT